MFFRQERGNEVADSREYIANTNVLTFGMKPESGAQSSPFMDERVRQAISMAWDRDTWINAFYNVSDFASQGMTVDSRWNSALTARWDGWWLDPKGKDFGPNARYYRHDLPEAKKLLAAAGYPNGLDVTSHHIITNEVANLSKYAETVDGMVNEAGIRIKINIVDTPGHSDFGGEEDSSRHAANREFAVDAVRRAVGAGHGVDVAGNERGRREFLHKEKVFAFEVVCQEDDSGADRIRLDLHGELRILGVVRRQFPSARQTVEPAFVRRFAGGPDERHTRVLGRQRDNSRCDVGGLVEGDVERA